MMLSGLGRASVAERAAVLFGRGAQADLTEGRRRPLHPGGLVGVVRPQVVGLPAVGLAAEDHELAAKLGPFSGPLPKHVCELFANSLQTICKLDWLAKLLQAFHSEELQVCPHALPRKMAAATVPDHIRAFAND